MSGRSSAEAWWIGQVRGKRGRNEWRLAEGRSVQTTRASGPGVVFLINALGAAGAEKQVILTARTIAEDGYAAAICTLSRPRGGVRLAQWLADAEAAGVRVLRTRGPCPWTAGTLVQCGRWLRQSPGRVIWTWGSRADVAAAIIFGRRIPRISSLRSASADLVRRRSMLWRWLDRTCVRYVSNSYRNVSQLGEVIPGVEERCRVLYNGLDAADLAQAPVMLPPARPDRLELVMLGNLRIRAKGYDIAVEAVRRLRSEGLLVRLRIAGAPFAAAPFEAEELRSLIARSGMQGAVELVGSVAHPFEFLRSGHVFMLLSRYEGLPNALLEAMGIGLPCLVTNVGDLAELTVDRVHARHVPVGDVDATTTVLRAALRDWAAFCGVGTAGRALIHDHFSPAAFRQRLRYCFAGLLPDSTWQVGGVA